MTTKIITGARLESSQPLRIKCPYCGNEFIKHVDINGNGSMDVAYCDADDTPGCGKAFVYRVPYATPITIRSFRIEDGSGDTEVQP